MRGKGATRFGGNEEIIESGAGCVNIEWGERIVCIHWTGVWGE